MTLSVWGIAQSDDPPFAPSGPVEVMEGGSEIMQPFVDVPVAFWIAGHYEIVEPLVEVLQSLVKGGALGADKEVVQPLGDVPHALMIPDDEVMHPFPEVLNAFRVGAKVIPEGVAQPLVDIVQALGRMAVLDIVNTFLDIVQHIVEI